MARVFDAFDERLERPVAVKVLRPETRALPGSAQRFQQEALIVVLLIHPNIVAVLDFGQDHTSKPTSSWSGSPGSTLRDEIIAEAPLSNQQRASTRDGREHDALAAAHESWVLHRDIKPGNMLQLNGHTKITDFGIARVRRPADRPDRPTT